MSSGKQKKKTESKENPKKAQEGKSKKKTETLSWGNFQEKVSSPSNLDWSEVDESGVSPKMDERKYPSQHQERVEQEEGSSRDRKDYERRDDRDSYQRREDGGGGRYQRDYQRRDQRDYPRRDYRDESNGEYQSRDNYQRRDYQRRDNFGRDNFRRNDDNAPKELPTQPPYTAFVGNLSFDLNENDLRDFFISQNCLVKDVRLQRQRIEGSDELDRSRHKGYGYVEFDTLVDLKAALEFNDTTFHERTLRVDIASGKVERERPSETEDVWRRKDASHVENQYSSFSRNDQYGDRKYRNDRDRGDRYGYRERRQDNYSSSSSSEERPKLNLLPRTNPEPVGAPVRTNKSDPFGGAKPVQTKEFSSKVEHDSQKPSAPKKNSQQPKATKGASKADSFNQFAVLEQEN